MRTNGYNLLIAIVIAVIIVLSMNLAGSLCFRTGRFSGALRNEAVSHL